MSYKKLIEALPVCVDCFFNRLLPGLQPITVRAGRHVPRVTHWNRRVSF